MTIFWQLGVERVEVTRQGVLDFLPVIDHPVAIPLFKLESLHRQSHSSDAPNLHRDAKANRSQ
jgi:hypothetical protein